MINLNLNKFDDSVSLGEELATRVCLALEAAIDKRGSAVLAVSGGSTPKIFFEILSSRPIAWEHVIITLVDERWVGEDCGRSNARLVKQCLLKNKASNAGFMPLYTGQHDIDRAIHGLEKQLQKLPVPFDAVILGMGGDGHTASFFPGGDNLAAAVNLEGKNKVATMRAHGAGEPRITFTLPMLIETVFLAIHIEGEDKLKVLAQAQQNGDADEMPVRHVLKASNNLEIFWAP